MIVVTACFILRWMVSGVESLLSETVPNESGAILPNYTPGHEVLFTTARYASGLLLVLGLMVLITGALWKRVINKKNLVIMHIVDGTLIVVVSTFIVLWGYEFDFIVAIEGGPVLEMARAKALTILTGILGLVVLGCSTAQYVKQGR